jgi:hypothetical protein
MKNTVQSYVKLLIFEGVFCLVSSNYWYRKELQANSALQISAAQKTSLKSSNYWYSKELQATMLVSVYHEIHTKPENRR